MVNNGDAAAGRALVDSILNVTPQGSAQYAEGLYWRATLSTSAVQAEHDYQRITVDYPFSSRVDDALLRLGQLELMQGDYDAVLLHLQRLTRNHPNSPLRARASYWTARAFFEKGDITDGCVANADAAAQAAQSDVELKNQIDYQHQRCHDAATSSTLGGDSNTADSAHMPKISRADTPTVSSNTATKHLRRSTRKGAWSTHTKHGAESPTSVEQASGYVNGTDGFAVQVAAYYDRSQADWFAAKLHKRGYSAHVDGTTAPFRVRIGHFTSRTAADRMLATLKARRIAGFVAKE